MNFTTDAWTSENHQAFVAVSESVHLEHNEIPLIFPLDIVEVAMVCSSLTLMVM